MRRVLLPIMLLLAVLLNIPGALAQQDAVTDTLENHLKLLAQLKQAGNFEQAQVAAEEFRAFLRRHRLPPPAPGVSILSDIYEANDDERSAFHFLAESELAARQSANLTEKVKLLEVLVREMDQWKMTQQALSAQKLLAATQDSLDKRQVLLERQVLLTQLDSLAALRQREQQARDEFLPLRREYAYLAGGLVLLLLLLMITSINRTREHWRKLLERKELEMDILRANMRHNMPAPVETPAETLAEPEEQELPYWLPGGQKPRQLALVIEPNRQVVLYLKSLLANSFQVETAFTATEGLQMAGNLLPDLIICDAVLNGKTGIDVIRQIKLAERTNHIPIILLSEKHGNEGKLDALRAGADAWFSRPVLDDEFDEQVKRLMDSRKQQHDQFARYLHLYYTESPIPVNDPFLLQTVRLIDQQLANPDFTGETIARQIQLSKNHFFKKLHVLTGKEPGQLIREMRLEKAKVLLEKRAGTPQAIAELVGFSSPGSFALAFKEYFGENTLLLRG